ncbi:MAG TPA: TIGR01777 family oxidoreductase [Bacteroidia bacterium]|nr:TIGR01777 family oxidoreductase [Bacteroidia bacterium]HNP97538.1 TIGR01777 family oxidoreductase [Bacteroidia bacterium]
MPFSGKILITGASGLIGSRLKKLFFDEKIDYVELSRSVQNTEKAVYQWNPKESKMPPEALNGVETIVNLAGTPIAEKRWTESRKREIIESRIQSIHTLYTTLQSTNHSVKTIVSASAVGYYGNAGEEWMTEDHPPGNDFLSMTCKKWEAEVKKLEALGIRVVILRIGFVLAEHGGALPLMKLPVRFFAGSAIGGGGNQYLSWIHINDLCRIIYHVIQHQNFTGVYNAVTDAPVTNKQFIQTLARVMHRPFWPFSVPDFILRLLLGEKAEIVIFGQRVSNTKIKSAGFQFQYRDLNLVFQTLLKT